MKTLHIQKVSGISGSEKHLLALLPELKKSGIICHFLAVIPQNDFDSTREFVNQLKGSGVIVDEIVIRSVISRRVLLKIKEYIKVHNFAIVHSHLIHADFWVALIKAMWSPEFYFISTKHGYDEAYINAQGFNVHQSIKFTPYYWVCRFSERYVDHSIFVSKGLQTLFISAGISKENTSVIYHGFDYDSPQKPSENFRLAARQIVVIGRLVPFKGHRHLIEAMKFVVEEIEDAKLLIIGNGPIKKVLREQSESMKLTEHVLFLGHRNNVSDYLQNSDVMVVPSIAEGFGLVFLEGFNHRIPLVAFDVPASNELIDHRMTGLLTPPFDVKRLADNIVALLKDPSFAQSMSQQAFNKLHKQFTLTNMVSSIINLYKLSEKDLQ